MDPSTTTYLHPTNRLWTLVRSAAERARQAGALQPIVTRQFTMEEEGAGFLMRVAENLARKPRPSDPASINAPANPFLPYDVRMYVADIPPGHVGLLNKYPVIDDHLLIVTRVFESQESPLTLSDFEAVIVALAAAATDREGLAFYNGGTSAGASQKHRHLQLIPLPLNESGSLFPFEPLLKDCSHEAIDQSPRLPFAHSVTQFASDVNHASSRQMYERYVQMLERHRLLSDDARSTRPYNLLLTRRLMLLVPRRQESFNGVSFNALAFAGALLVKDDQQYEQLTRGGIWQALREVTLPKDER